MASVVPGGISSTSVNWPLSDLGFGFLDAQVGAGLCGVQKRRVGTSVGRGESPMRGVASGKPVGDYRLF